MQYNYSNKRFTRRAKRIRIIGVPDNLRPDKCSSTVNTGALYIRLGTCWYMISFKFALPFRRMGEGSPGKPKALVVFRAAMHKAENRNTMPPAVKRTRLLNQ